jgi:hypothetical protein
MPLTTTTNTSSVARLRHRRRHSQLNEAWLRLAKVDEMETFCPVVHWRRSTTIGAGFPIGGDDFD